MPPEFRPALDAALAGHRAMLDGLAGLAADLEAVAVRLRDCLAQGGKVVWLGNGGSAADSQHLASEMVGRFRRERGGLASLALTTDTSILTSVGNDYGFEHVFARQVEALCAPPDVLMAISTSGNSANVIRAVDSARRLGIHSVGLLGGDGGRLRGLCDTALVVPARETPRIQEGHILIGHILCELMEL
jgi:D-sedoheptulose 7-phosphate isomerase